MFRLITDSLGLKTSGIYQIRSECCKVYVKHAVTTAEIRHQEHEAPPSWPAIEVGQSRLWIWDISMKFNSTCRLDKAAGYTDHTMKDTIQT
jgi:hypothetical protein